MKIILKSSLIRLSENLFSQEFACKCSYPECEAIIYDESIVQSFQALRDDLGVPLTVTSGFRCSRHGKDVGGMRCSRHLFGGAIDIACPEGMGIIDFADKVRKHFNFIIMYRDSGFVHADNRD